MKKIIPVTTIILIFSITAACMGPTKTTPVSNPGTHTPVAGSMPRINTPAPTKTEDPAAPVWVSNPTDQTVLRVDPASNKISAVIPIPGRPEMVAVGGNGVWVLDQQHNRVFHIDPRTDQVKANIPLPEGEAADIAAGGGSVWVGMTGKINLSNQVSGQAEEITAPGMVVQIDPKTDKVQNQFPIQPVNRLTVSGSSLWILSRTLLDTPVQVIDLNSRQGMAMPFHNAPDWLPADAFAVDAGDIWLFSLAYSAIFRATLDGHINAMIRLEEHQPTGLADLLLYASNLWVATPWGELLRIDPKSNHILAKLDLGTPLTRLIPGSGSIWVLSQQTATLFRIDPNSNTVTAQIKTGSLLEPTVVPSPTPRIVLWNPCPDAATSRLKIGDLAYVTKDPPLANRIRKEPNTDAEILGYITPGGGMQIIDGPSCGNGWVWWKVKNADLEGWTPEGDKETYWLVPYFK